MRPTIPLLLLCLAIPLRSAALPRLAGIVALPDFKRVVFESSPDPRSGPWPCIFAEGQRDGELEVLAIDPESRSLKCLNSGKGLTLTLKPPLEKDSPKPTIYLEDTPLLAVVLLYGELLGRTVLQSPLVPTVTQFTLQGAPTNRAETAKLLEKAFRENEIVTIPDGEKFVLLVSKSQAAKARPRSPASGQPPLISGASGTNGSGAQQKPATQASEIIPPGMIDFRGADLNQVMQLYAELLGGKADRSQFPVRLQRKFPNDNQFRLYPVYLLTRTSISKEEAIYAVETLTSWYGVKFEPATNGFLKVVYLPPPDD